MQLSGSGLLQGRDDDVGAEHALALVFEKYRSGFARDLAGSASGLVIDRALRGRPALAIHTRVMLTVDNESRP